MCAQVVREQSALYSDWLADFQRRLALHDHGARLLADDLADRTEWRVLTRHTPALDPYEDDEEDEPDVLCHRGVEGAPLCLELELPETLVRRRTLARLRTLGETYDLRVVLIAEAGSHERVIRDARRMLARAGVWVPVAALDPELETLTGADW